MESSEENIELRKKPNVSTGKLSSFLESSFPLQNISLTSFKELNSYEDQNFYFEAEVIQRVVPSYDSLNKLGTGLSPFVAKVYNQGDSENPAVVEAQVEALFHLQKNQDVDLRVPVEVYGVDSGKTSRTLTYIQDENANETRSIVRVLSYIPGKMFEEAGATSTRLFLLGILLGKMDKALFGFNHPALKREFVWNLKQGGAVIRQYCELLDPVVKNNLQTVAQRFEGIQSVLASLRESVVHNDANDNNILVCNVTEKEELAIIDFGDLVFSWTVSEIAIAMAYVIINGISTREDPLQFAMKLLQGYQTIIKLNENERAVLPTLICTRMAVSICMGAKSLEQDPDNEYLKVHSIPARLALAMMIKVSSDEFWKMYEDSLNEG